MLKHRMVNKNLMDLICLLMTNFEDDFIQVAETRTKKHLKTL